MNGAKYYFVTLSFCSDNHLNSVFTLCAKWENKMFFSLSIVSCEPLNMQYIVCSKCYDPVIRSLN